MFGCVACLLAFAGCLHFDLFGWVGFGGCGLDGVVYLRCGVWYLVGQLSRRFWVFGFRCCGCVDVGNAVCLVLMRPLGLVWV